MNRSPAFQFYPDKWQSHTRRLSDSSYRVFHELLCWMWQNSPDYCSIEASPDAVACAVAMPIECVRIAVAEIMNIYSPLLKIEGERWVSNGLRKEAKKQHERRKQASDNANARWNNADASNNNADASFSQCFPSPSPSPSSSPTHIPKAVSVISKKEARSGEIPEAFQSELLAAYRRPADARLSFMELSALAEIVRDRMRYEDEWRIIQTLRQREPRYFPQSLSKLLTQWQETLDRASVWVPAVKTVKSLMEKELDSIR